MTTREQRLLELVERWRDLRHQNDDEYGLYGTYTYQAAEQCARELAAILNEPVEVSEEMVERFIWGWRSAKPLLVLRPGMDDYAIRTALTYAIKELGQ